MVSAKDALQAAPKDVIAEALTELNLLILGPIAVSQVGRLRRAQMKAQAFLRTAHMIRRGDIERQTSSPIVHSAQLDFVDTHKPIA